MAFILFLKFKLIVASDQKSACYTGRGRQPPIELRTKQCKIYKLVFFLEKPFVVSNHEFNLVPGVIYTKIATLKRGGGDSVKWRISH